jgi:hypothetical protein
MPTATLSEPLALRQRVIDTRKQFRRGEVTLAALYAVIDDYLDACAATFKQKWPTRKFRRPSRAYIARAL